MGAWHLEVNQVSASSVENPKYLFGTCSKYFGRYFTLVEGSSFDDTLGGVKEAHFWSRVIDLIRSFDDPNDSNDPLVRVSEN